MKNVAKNKRIDKDKNGHISWNELDVKDKIAYIMAIILIASGIGMAFTAFLVHPAHEITTGPLMYVGEAFTTGGALLSVGLYVKNRFCEISNYIEKRLDKDK